MRINKTSWKRSTWILGFVAPMAMTLIVLSIASRTADASAAAEKAEVKIDNFNFTPPTITVKAGTEITWTNEDEIPHNVVSDDHTFKSKVLDTGEKFTLTVSKPGTYSYSCSMHPKMTGKVIVE